MLFVYNAYLARFHKFHLTKKLSIYYTWFGIFYTGEKSDRTCQKKFHDFIGISRDSHGSGSEIIPKTCSQHIDALYRYYRCTRKNGECSEPYTQEKLVTGQCLEILKPLAISPEQANHLRALIDAETKKEGSAAGTEVEQISEKLSDIQKKLNKLTRGYLDELTVSLFIQHSQH